MIFTRRNSLIHLFRFIPSRIQGTFDAFQSYFTDEDEEGVFVSRNLAGHVYFPTNDPLNE